VEFSITISTIFHQQKAANTLKTTTQNSKKIIHKNFTTKRLSQNNPTMIKHQPQNKTQQTTTTINEKF